MDLVALVKKLASTKQLSAKEQIDFVRTVNKSMSSLVLILQKARNHYEDMQKTDSVLQKLQKK